jgi:hypothetical protein
VIQDENDGRVKKVSKRDYVSISLRVVFLLLAQHSRFVKLTDEQSFRLLREARPKVRLR